MDDRVRSILWGVMNTRNVSTERESEIMDEAVAKVEQVIQDARLDELNGVWQAGDGTESAYRQHMMKRMDELRDK